MFRQGFILDLRRDLIWFLTLPYVCLIVAFACQQWMPAVVVASVGLWITIPHHFATWLRTYGVREDWERWKDQLIVGPLVIISLTAAGFLWAPFTLLMVSYMWDHQHSIMQQHGFARIYDFKAKAGAPWTGRWDFWLNWVLYGNMFLTMPLFTKVWVRELLRFQIPITAEAIHVIHVVSWTATAAFGLAYFMQTIWAVRKNHAVNPYKYVFLGGSYFLWYFVSWHTGSVLVYGIAHRLMHGLQYIVIVYWFLRRRREKQDQFRGVASRLVRPGNILLFLGASALYAVAFHLLTRQPVEQFGFGLLTFMSHYQDVSDASNIEPLTYQEGYDLMAATVISSVAMIHYYFDSFIWKVRDRGVQSGL